MVSEKSRNFISSQGKVKLKSTNLFLANSAMVWCNQECDMKCIGLVELNDKLILCFQENQSFFHDFVILTLSHPRVTLQILLCLTPDNFTHQMETPWE